MPFPECSFIQKDDDALEGEWYEGRVYGEEARHEDKIRGWTRSRYLALKVIWVSRFDVMHTLISHR